MSSKRLFAKSNPIVIKVGYSCLHGAFLLILAILALNIDYNFAPEESQIKSTLFIDDLLSTKSDLSGDYTFIDVSASKVVVPRVDLNGNQALTDRKALSRLFKQISNKPDQPIICDLLFDIETNQDEEFSKTIKQVNGLILPFSQEGNQVLNPYLRGVNTGYAGYQQSSGLYSSDKLLKYQYSTPSGAATIPLKIVEQISGMTARKTLGLLWLKGKVYFNTIIYENYISISDLDAAGGKSKLIPLNEIVDLLEADQKTFYDQFFRGKTIIIGDFSGDLHPTYSGKVPGSLILTNLIIGFLKGDNQLSLSWLLFMLLSFSLLSYLVFYPPIVFEKVINYFKNTPFGSALVEFFTFFLITGFLSLVSFLLFHKHIDVVLISLYLTAVTLYLEFKANKKNKL